MNLWPIFETPKLAALQGAFACRRTALQHHSRVFECNRQIEKGYERVNFDYTSEQTPLTEIRLSAWSDGVMFLRACQGSKKKGWIYNVRFYGNLSEVAPEEVVVMFETTLVTSTQSKPSECEGDIWSVWKDVEPHME